VAVFFLSFLFLISTITAILYFSKPSRDAYRFLLAHGAWVMIKENPFLGKGIGTFMDYCNRYTNNFGASYAHNCYLQIWAESGIFSLLCFLLFVWFVFYKSIKVSLRLPKSPDFFILIGLTAGLLGFLVHSFFDVHFYSFQLSFLFWAVLGLTVALGSNLEQELKLKP
ncbi:MAG: O-antigen ligase family protein, partial [Candidatus Omnitrophica bacterium]|nr:O-antigen ligase family protein [Candidatus Omnitrophota bacterium]